MSSFEAARERFSPLFEVYVGRSAQGCEMLYIGEICDMEIYDHELDQRFHLTRLPVPPRAAPEMVAWIKEGPDELNRALEADLSEEFGETVGLAERYPGGEVVR